MTMRNGQDENNPFRGNFGTNKTGKKDTSKMR